MTSRRWQWSVTALVALVAVSLSACTSSAPPPKIRECQAGCGGSIHGADYLIKVPANWNGTLLVYSHGYQFAGASLHPSLSPDDVSGTGNDPLSAALLDKGFALAGSGWPSTGWAVRAGVEAANSLYDRFSKLVSKPQRTYVWGSSLGGLVTEQLAEQSRWVDGAAAMCGVVGGPLVNFDNWLQAAVATEALLGVNLTLTGPLTSAGAAAEKLTTNAAIIAARRDRDGGGAAKLVYLADLLGLPDKSAIFFNDGQANDIGAAAQNLAAYVAGALLFLAEARDRFGGNPARTPPASEAPLTAEQRAEIIALHGNPDAYAAQIDAFAAPPTSSTARDKLAATGTPTGNIAVPTVTLHGTQDPLAIVENEAVLHSVVAARDRTNRLVQLFVAPHPSEFSGGLGHCKFSMTEQIGLIDTLDQWVRQGPRPAIGEIANNLGPALEPDYAPPKWPSGAVD